MITTTDNRTIKQLIKQELPILMKKDRNIRQWIIQLADELGVKVYSFVEDIQEEFTG